jgi:DNA-binding NarL/FixJ family response regulator
MKILVVDDHHLIREGLRPLLETLAEGEPVEVLEAATLAKALETAAAHDDLDLALVDLRLPDVVGFESVSTLRARHPALPVVVMSGENERGIVRDALDHGALGFIPKSSSSRVILGALRLVLGGGTYIPREAIDDGAAMPTRVAGPRGADIGLTPRQSEVLALVLAGKSNKVIGREMALAEGTVKNHVAAVLKALNVTTRTQAVIAAAKRGIKA